MLRGTFIPNSGTPAVLFKTDRNWMEHDLRVNNRPVLDIQTLLEGAFAHGFYRQNMRNILSFKVWRGVDDKGNPFRDCEGALLHMIYHAQSLPVAGTFLLEIQGQYTQARVYLKNALRETTEVFDADKGLIIGWQHVINGAEFSAKF